MSISVRCPGCERRLRAPDHFSGRQVRCPGCQSPVTIPAPEPQEPETEPETYRLAIDETTDPPPPVWNATRQRTEAAESDATSGLPPIPRRSTKRSRKAAALPPPPGGLREYWYGFLALALLPLAMSLFQSEDFEQRIQRTIENHPEVSAADTEDALFGMLPDHKFEGAHLSRDTWMHWVYAALSGLAFFAVLVFGFGTGYARPRTVLSVALFTGTVGIFLLLAFQWVAFATNGVFLRGRSILVLLFYLVKFIGFSYRCALEEGNGFLLSVVGFTCGVGLCEELCKAVPIIWYLRAARDANWRGAVVIGLASGIGFGVSEGISYSADYYNGVSTWGIYVVRFVSCVALHATWSGAVALLMYRNQDYLQGDLDWVELGQAVLIYLGASMILHGLYDTLLKQSMNFWALTIAVGSFAWLTWLLKRTRAEHGETATA